MPQPFSLTGGNMKYSGVGGQAVMEGVMMKNEDRYAVAVRKPDHTIDVKVSTFKETIKNKKLRRLPFIRGVINFIESLILGMQTLMYSASFFEDDEDEKKKKAFNQKVTGILYKYGDKESTPMLDKRIQDIYNEYYEEETDYKALKHKYNQYMLEREDEIRERLKETKNIEDYIKYVCVGNYIDFGVTGNIDDQMLENLLNKVNDLNISKLELKIM